MIDVCCLLEVGWRRHGSRMLWMEVMRYNLWWSGKEMELLVWES